MSRGSADSVWCSQRNDRSRGDAYCDYTHERRFPRAPNGAGQEIGTRENGAYCAAFGLAIASLVLKARLRKLLQMAVHGNSALFAFLSGSGRDARGRSLDDILSFSDYELEAHHDFIQWLFPLDTPSAAVPGSPVLTEIEIQCIRQCDLCRANLLRAAARMEKYYSGSDHWLVPFDHNHRRITRIIRSLRLLVGREEARSFLAGIEGRIRRSGGQVAQTSRRFWRGALD